MTDTGYSGLWLPREKDPRNRATPPRGERECLVRYLDDYRTTLALKCEDLAPAQLATRAVPPSNISLLGLVRHMARVEHSWFGRVIPQRMDLPRLFAEEGLDAGFSWRAEADERLVAEAFDLWRTQVDLARRTLEGASLDDLVPVHGVPTEVRDIVVHMIEEYARHCGHADLVRERIDGRTGQ